MKTRKKRASPRVLALILAAALVWVIVGSFIWSAAAEEESLVVVPHIVYTRYDATGLYALVELPEDGMAYYMRVTFFLYGNTYIVIVAPISEEGEMRIWIACNCEHISMQIVDKPDALCPGTYTPYEALGW